MTDTDKQLEASRKNFFTMQAAANELRLRAEASERELAALQARLAEVEGALRGFRSIGSVRIPGLRGEASSPLNMIFPDEFKSIDALLPSGTREGRGPWLRSS